MSWLTLGAFIGGFWLGLLIMAALSAASEAERREERR